jgi:Domain of unknown function (DUF4328)
MSCPGCSFPVREGQRRCPRCGAELDSLWERPAGYPRRLGERPPGPYSLSVARHLDVSQLGTATMVLLGVTAAGEALILACRLTGAQTAASVIGIPTLLAMLATAPLFIVWFFRIRHNAGLWGTQRRSQGCRLRPGSRRSSSLWFPYQIAVDALRSSSAPDAARAKAHGVIAAWWACWLLAWFTSYQVVRTVATRPDGTIVHNFQLQAYLGSTVLSNTFTAAAAVLGILVVQALTQRQKARLVGDA